MELYRRWVDEPWRDMSAAVRGMSIAVVILVAYLLEHAVGGATGFVLGLVVALALAVLIPVCWQALQH